MWEFVYSQTRYLVNFLTLPNLNTLRLQLRLYGRNFCPAHTNIIKFALSILDICEVIVILKTTLLNLQSMIIKVFNKYHDEILIINIFGSTFLKYINLYYPLLNS